MGWVFERKFFEFFGEKSNFFILWVIKTTKNRTIVWPCLRSAEFKRNFLNFFAPELTKKRPKKPCPNYERSQFTITTLWNNVYSSFVFAFFRKRDWLEIIFRLMALLSSLFKNPLVPGTKLRLGSIEVVLRYGFVKSRLWKPKSKSGTQLLLNFW